MSTGIVGNVRGADITPADVEIWMHYTPNRTTTGNVTLTQLDSSQVLIPVNDPNNPNTTIIETMGGLFSLTLPAAQFSTTGIYSIIIRPVQIRTSIVDCGVLSAYPNIRGLVLDTSTIPASYLNAFQNNGLVGYRIEYLQMNPTSEMKINNFFTIVTSNNFAEPIINNTTNANQKAIQYVYNDNSPLTFVTLTPSSAGSTTPNSIPFLGTAGQQIIITNTFFNPIVMEIEMVDYDIETLAYAVLGDQIKSISDGVYTIYNFQDQIYKQYSLYEIDNQMTGAPLYEVRQQMSQIDFTKQFTTITTV
jgi:hypothetical protein